VYGGVFDEQFETPSKQFFAEVKNGRFELCTSAVVRAEIVPAPDCVRAFFDSMLETAQLLSVSRDALLLRQAYLESKIVTERWADDALHVALATVSHCAVIVSWNFKHIVHFQKVPLYNAVNTLKGYGSIGIHSPSEVLNYDEAKH
jgi:hypothetical protein